MSLTAWNKQHFGLAGSRMFMMSWHRVALVDLSIRSNVAISHVVQGLYKVVLFHVVVMFVVV